MLVNTLYIYYIYHLLHKRFNLNFKKQQFKYDKQLHNYLECKNINSRLNTVNNKRNPCEANMTVLAATYIIFQQINRSKIKNTKQFYIASKNKNSIKKSI